MSHSKAASGVRIKRAYEPPSPHDGVRILVDRLWGLKKADAGISQWMKEIAPSDELRKWFGHDPVRWEEFRRRYKAERRTTRRWCCGRRCCIEELAQRGAGISATRRRLEGS